jgi:pSer/pThr/pTyr-binding forkhead associated (FHA) protein
MSQQVDHQTSDTDTRDTAASFRADVFRADVYGKLEALAAAAAGARVSAVDDVPSGSAMLVVKRGPNAGARFLLDQPVTTVGRNPYSDIYLDDLTVSRRHVEFRRESPHVRIVDLDSLNGTFVNRQPVPSAVLANGDEIGIGKFRLVFLTKPSAG